MALRLHVSWIATLAVGAALTLNAQAPPPAAPVTVEVP